MFRGVDIGRAWRIVFWVIVVACTGRFGCPRDYRLTIQPSSCSRSRRKSRRNPEHRPGMCGARRESPLWPAGPTHSRSVAG